LGEETLEVLKAAYAKVQSGEIVPPGNFSETTVKDFVGL
jgi:hypothetical protein